MVLIHGEMVEVLLVNIKIIKCMEAGLLLGRMVGYT